jgi:glucosamine kinase
VFLLIIVYLSANIKHFVYYFKLFVLTRCKFDAAWLCPVICGVQAMTTSLSVKNTLPLPKISSMLVIADSGSSKADWRFLTHLGEQVEISTPGFNPVFHNEDFILNECNERFSSRVRIESNAQVYFYGSGCWDLPRKKVIVNALKPLFPQGHVNVFHDLIGAARATCGDQPGISCILGTGSNSCVFDGNEITDGVTNLGYLLGDEGSGTHLGKAIIQAYFYRELPQDLIEEFSQYIPGGKTQILDTIYKGESPNQFLASFSPFLHKHQNHPFISDLIQNSFGVFLDRHVCKYEGYQKLPVHFVGSIAFHFREILKKAMEERGLKVGKIIKKPIDGLVHFHLSNNA